MPLISYMLTATNKRLLISRVTAIQIDVHPTGENLTNMPHASRAQSVYGLRPYVSHAINA
jgi:hypothetical protein